MPAPTAPRSDRSRSPLFRPIAAALLGLGACGTACGQDGVANRPKPGPADGLHPLGLAVPPLPDADAGAADDAAPDTGPGRRAVERALAWFARNQRPAGFWNGAAHGAGRGDDDDPATEPDPDKREAGRDADVGLTGLATLAFLRAGHTPTHGRHAATVDRAIHWLIDVQNEDGSLHGGANYYARPYCHGIATLALAEALKAEKTAGGVKASDDAPSPLRAAVTRAVAYTASQQYPDGGWRYSQRAPVGDLSVFGWQCRALLAAHAAGVPLPEEVRAKMIDFLRERSETIDGDGNLVQYPYGGLARYIPKEGYVVKPAMTAEALLCKQLLGLRRNQPAATEAVAYLARHPPALRDWNLYAWYHAAAALRNDGGSVWRGRRVALRRLLIAEQYAAGDRAGAWPVRPTRENYSAYGGQLYTTALATLCLLDCLNEGPENAPENAASQGAGKHSAHRTGPGGTAPDAE